jgi:hypothetical protein
MQYRLLRYPENLANEILNALLVVGVRNDAERIRRRKRDTAKIASLFRAQHILKGAIRFDLDI